MPIFTVVGRLFLAENLVHQQIHLAPNFHQFPALGLRLHLFFVLIVKFAKSLIGCNDARLALFWRLVPMLPIEPEEAQGGANVL